MKSKIIALISFLFVPSLGFCQYTADFYQKDAPIVTQEPSRLELGLMIGDMRTARSSYLATPFVSPYDLSGNNRQNNFEAGVQLKLYVNPINEIRTFVYTNAQEIFNSSTEIFDQQVMPGFNYSTMTIQTNYIGRLGVGFDTDPFDGFTATVGVGLAVVNQKLSTTINEFNSVSASVVNNSIMPSAMVGLNYKICNSCVNGHPFLISAQVTGEQYPNLAVTTVGTLGAYQSNVEETWQFRGDLVFSTRI